MPVIFILGAIALVVIYMLLYWLYKPIGDAVTKMYKNAKNAATNPKPPHEEDSEKENITFTINFK